MTEQKVTYNEDDIQVLNDLDHIRKRKGMYLGESDNPHHLFSEAYDNAKDEIQAGYGDLIQIYIDTEKNIYTVIDNGRGIPIGKKKLDSGKEEEIIKVLCTKSNSGGKFNSGEGAAYTLSAGLHGLGTTLINALSMDMTLITERDGRKVSYNTQTDKVTYEKSNRHGTTISFKPNPQYFDEPNIPQSFILNAAKTANAFKINTEVYIDGVGQNVQADMSDLFTVEPDITVFQQYPIIYSGNNPKEERLAVFLRYTSDTKDRYKGYTNLLYNSAGGTHISFISKLICEAWSEYIETSKIKTEVELHKSDYLVGLRCICACFISNPEFSSQTKERLSVRKEYFNKFYDSFKTQIVTTLKMYDKQSRALVKRFEEYRISQNKLLSRKQISSLIEINEDKPDRIRRRSNVPGLIECLQTKRDGTELFICEGLSAIGSITRTRNKNTQAGLPLRGKVMNVAGLDIKKSLKSEVIRNITNAVGSGIGPLCDSTKRRYDKIIISTDADPDGCFVGNHKVRLVDGSVKTFEELVELNKQNPDSVFEVFSKNNKNELVVGYGRNPRITRYVNKLCKVTLDNGMEIQCTMDHRFLLADGSYKEAQHLTVTDSLNSMYFKYDDDGRYKVKTTGDRTWYKLHRYLAKQYIDDPEGKDVHHINRNYLDNRPDNLQILSRSEHSKQHINLCTESIVKYNKSDKHKEDVRRAFRNGSYEGKSYFIEYNKSEEHKQRVMRMNQEGKLNFPEQKLVNPIKFGKTLLNVYGELTYSMVEQESYDKGKVPIPYGIDCIIDLFGSWENYIEMVSNSNTNGFERENYVTSHYNASHNRIRSCMCIISSEVLNTTGRLTEGAYEKLRVEKYKDKKYPKYNCWSKYFKTYKEFEEMSRNYNHKVLKVETLNLSDPVPVYCMTVPDYHNFLLDTSTDKNMGGVFVHNCHIQNLLLSTFVNLLPDIVKQGCLYVVIPPFYGWVEKGEKHYSNKLEDIPKGIRYIRYKGLGEMNDDDYEYGLMNPRTRVLYQVEYPDDVDEFNRILGTSAGKSDIMERLGLIRYE